MSIITVTNHGPLITASSYWDSAIERAGKLFCSVNAGCIRILLPRSARQLIQECRSSQYAILSRGPWPEMGKPDAVEIVWEDGSESPFAMHFGAESFDLLPGEPGEGQQWLAALWMTKKGKPHKALERPCYWRRVPSIPWLKPWEG